MCCMIIIYMPLQLLFLLRDALDSLCIGMFYLAYYLIIICQINRNYIICKGGKKEAKRRQKGGKKEAKIFSVIFIGYVT